MKHGPVDVHLFLLKTVACKNVDVCYRDGKIDILCDVDDILTLVDNHLIKCVSIRGSAFVKPLIGNFLY